MPPKSRAKAQKGRPRTPTKQNSSSQEGVESEFRHLNIDDAPQGPTTLPPTINHPSLSTPSKQQQATKFVTPQNKGSSTRSHGRSGHTTVEALNPFIKEDIMLDSQRVKVLFLPFLKHVLKKCAAVPVHDDGTDLLNEVLETTREFCNGPKFKKARKYLEEYCKKKSKEKEMYPPLVDCINELLARLRRLDFPSLKKLSKFNPVAHENDPNELHAAYDGLEGTVPSKRKPDITILANMLLKEITQLEEDLKQEGKPEDAKSQWPGILATGELKLEGNEGFPMPPETYTKEDTPKTYRILHDRDTRRNGKCASMRYLFTGNVQEGDVYTPDMGPTPGSTSHSGYGSNQQSLSSQAMPTSENKPKLKANAQNAMYGSEMLCRAIYSKHSFNLLIVDNILWVCRYDRQNAIQTTGLNFVEDMPFFLALLVAFQRFDKSDWGVEPSLAPPSLFTKLHAHTDLVNVVFNDNIQVSIDPHQRRPPGPVLKGRATTIFDVKNSSTNPVKGELVIKAYWPEKTRLSEADIILAARNALEESENPLDKALANHLPDLIASLDFASTDTGDILKELPAEAAPKSSDNRILRLLLFRKLVPIDDVKDKSKFLDSWIECFKCHYALWKKGFEHGDISVWNLMWDKEGNCGILNDWDLAFVRGGIKIKGKTVQGRGRERTGTLPFMARDLLKDKFIEGNGVRLYRHELESFVWVLTWVCIKDYNSALMRSWRRGTLTEVRSAKLLVLSDFRDLSANPAFQDAWEKCKLLLELLISVDGELRIQVEPSNELLHDTVLKVMSKEITNIKQIRALFK